MKLKNYFKLNKIEKNKKYILGLSGGPDSIFLFWHSLHILSSENLVVAHVNYNYRDSAREAEDLVKKICKENNVKLFIKNANHDGKVNFEDWARNVRYDFFSEISKSENIKDILIAHNYNDDIETYALQKQRKNLVSYFGLKPISEWKKINVIRPMLEIKKVEILNWLKENNLDFNFDETNLDTNFKRNKIRQEISDEDIKLYEKEKISKNRMMKWVYEKITPMLKSEFSLEEFIPLNDKEELVFIYEYLKSFVPNFEIGSIKKNITSEVAKELRTTKSFLIIKVSKGYSLVKDRRSVFLVKNEFLWFEKNITSEEDLNNIPEFKNIDEIKNAFKVHGNIVISNNFLEYQPKKIFRNKKIREYFSKNKISYRSKIENAAIWIYKNKDIIINKIK